MAAKIVNQVESIYARKCKNSDYGNTFLDRLNKIRINQKLSDFSLDVDGELIHVHKLALAIASDYFAAMFETDMKERREGTVKLQDVDVVAVKALVEYIYSGIITLTEGNVEAVLSASDLLQIVWVKEECIQFLKSNLNGENCFRVRKLADMHFCQGLHDVSHTYILEHFDDLIDKEDLLLLSFEEMKELIKSQQHFVKSSDTAYKAVIGWIKHDLERRRVHLAELISQISLSLVSPKFLTNHIVAEPLLNQDHKSSQLLIAALNSQLTKVSQLYEQCQTESNHRNENFYVFLTGGLQRNLRGCKVYDIFKKKLVSIPRMNKNRYHNSAVSLNNIVYSVGGLDNEILNTAECYDPISKRWSYIAPMNNTRYGCGICGYNDLIYVVGGWDTSTVESYNPAINKWHLCQNIPGRNQNFNRATVAGNSIYSLTRRFYCTSTLLRFDPRDGKWCILNKIQEKNDQFQLVSYDRTLFALGRGDCIQLDIRVDRWEPMSCMLSERYSFSAAIAEKDIYVLGGKEEHGSPITKVERFNIYLNEWKNVDSIEIEHCDGGAAVVSGDFDFN